jgi:DNA recombination protein RmuC
MSVEFILLLALVILGFSLVIYFLKKKSSTNDSLAQWLSSMQKSLDATNQNITVNLQNSTTAMNQRLDKAAQIIGEVGKEVGQMAEIGRSMKDLQDFLRSPKLRGNIGEQVLKDLISQMFPKQSYSLQYTFHSGETVDAVIKTQNGLIPIDSKFPMENFKKLMSSPSDTEKETAKKDFARDVKKHITDIAKKYILTNEGTIDYALMYIPSEPVYYEIMSNNPELADYAHNLRVLPVSPSTFYAYLRAILMSFEGQKIATEAKQILQALRAIQTDATKFNDNLNLLSRHLTNAYNTMSSVTNSFTQLSQKLTHVQAISNEKEEITKLPLD